MTQWQRPPAPEGWHAVDYLGSGSGGSVYRIVRDADGAAAAMKIIRIPRNADEIETLRGMGLNDEEISHRFENQLIEVYDKFSALSEMRGEPNVVPVDDVQYVHMEGGQSCAVFARMELLTPLRSVLGGSFSEETVLAIGIDVLSGLERYQQRRLVHGDIRPENVLVFRDGSCGLSDFGVADRLAEMRRDSDSGACDFASPEVFLGKPAQSESDIYSVGMLLYWLCNGLHVPFTPAYSTGDAVAMRMSGGAIPEPQFGSDALKRIIAKACAYDTQERYRSASAMRRELMKLLKREEPAAPAGVPAQKYLDRCTDAGSDRGGSDSGFLDLSEQKERPTPKAPREEPTEKEIRLFDDESERKHAVSKRSVAAESSKPRPSKRLIAAAIILFGLTLGVIGMIVYFVLTNPEYTNETKELNGKANTAAPTIQKTDYPTETAAETFTTASSVPGETQSATPVSSASAGAPGDVTPEPIASTGTPEVSPTGIQTPTPTPTPKPTPTPEPTLVPPPEGAQTFYSDGYNAVCVAYEGCNVRLYWSSKKKDSKIARIVGRLECGDQVAVLANYSNWTLIRIVKDGKEVYGWVFEQYLYDGWMKDNHSVNDSLNNSVLMIPPIGTDLFPTEKKTVKKTAVEMYDSPGAVDDNGQRKSPYFTIPKSNDGRHVVSIYSEKNSYENENGETVNETWEFCVYSWDDSSGNTDSRFGWINSDLLMPR